MSSILHETGAIIDRFFSVGGIGKPPHYRHKQSCMKVSDKPLSDRNGATLIGDIYARIESNWRRSQPEYGKIPSEENWRFVPRPDLDEDNTSPEVTLERKIVRLPGRNWANQVPTSSGLTHHRYDKARNIDLVHKLDSDHCEFIELKVNSDTPLFAAMEILTYGCLYLFSRQHRDDLGYGSSRELLSLAGIHLRVLAPHSYYAPDPRQPDQRYDLEWLEDLVNDGLRQFVGGLAPLDLVMDFRFDAFAPDFEWSPSGGDMPDETLQAALGDRRPVYSRS